MPVVRSHSTALSVLAAIVLAIAVGQAQSAQIDIHGPSGSVAFGTRVAVLANGNVVVTDPSGPVSNVGAVYLYTPAGVLISTLTGASADDHVGSGGIVLLGNGNFVVFSPQWNNGVATMAGAATWVNGTTGLNGAVTAGNSIVGTTSGDQVGFYAAVLANGNYVVSSPNWNGNIGAATWGSGVGGVTGIVSSVNSLIGSSAGDKIGSQIGALTNGNYVVASSAWNGNFGAVTWGNGSTGVSGVVSSSNSLVGSSASDMIGALTTITILTNGNYVVASPKWNGNTGAVTWGDGASGTSGTISASNSLVGSVAGDQVGFRAVALSNGNYVVSSQGWNGNRGAATWGNGTVGVKGVVSSFNSLVGSTPTDYVGYFVTALKNGNYVVRSPYWSGTAGAVTWGDGTTGITDVITASNSLLGSTTGDQVGLQSVVALNNGNYVIASPHWNGDTGAATWGPGTSGVKGVLSSFNSLVGAATGDKAGSTITALQNGNYVVGSPAWSGNTGAATWGNGVTGTAGVVTSGNSLTGAATSDLVGGPITALVGGDYVVCSPLWNGGRGAVTKLSGTAATSAVVSAANSLVGSAPTDGVCAGAAALALSNGNYMVRSRTWNSNAGALTWGSGASGVVGPVSPQNSLVGTISDENVGGGVGAGSAAFDDGYFLVRSPDWGGGVGAVTLANGAFALIGTLQPWNSVQAAAPGGGGLITYAYDAARHQLAVGRPAENIVSLFTSDQLFANNFQ